MKKKRDNSVQWIKTFLFIVFIGWCFTGIAQSNGYKLVWSDEFDYTGKPDNAKWGYDIGGGGWGNQEEQYYTDRLVNAKVENGKLIITALKESYGGSQYTSARLLTRYKGDWLYGRMEIRAKLPEGIGTWAAIWMLPTDWEYGGWPNSGEIDIMEHVGYDMGNVHGTIHTEAYNGMIGTQRGDNIIIPDVHEAFHNYSIEWTEDTIDFLADDVIYFSFPNYHTGYDRWPFDKRFNLLMNIAIGGTWGGQQGIDDNIFPQTMEIEYVRVYQKFTQKEINGPTEVYANQENINFTLTEFEGAVYTWSFPDGVSITEGQGSNSITVNWGKKAGTVSVLQSYGDDLFTSALDVTVIFTPGDSSLIIRSNETEIGTWQLKPGNGNSITTKYDE
jgi:beta-glucanase (GH16 family)